MIYKNCNNVLVGFHDTHIRLNNDAQDDLRRKRKLCRDRLTEGLKDSEPTPTRFVKQGSYAMFTINQHPNNDYDIDDGVVFKKYDMKNGNDNYISSYQARKMVQKALEGDKRFSKEPELKENCIRVHYSEGYHVDVPVYRETVDDEGEKNLELASTEWKDSFPEGVTKWFNDSVSSKSPDSTNGQQMRRIVRMLKFWANGKTSWNMPSGFILSALVDEHYVSVKDRDDESLYKTMKSILQGLCMQSIYGQYTVTHPIDGTNLTEGKEAKMRTLKEKLDTAINNILDVLEETDCTEKQALKAWRKFFHYHEYFDSKIEVKSVFESEEPSEPVDMHGRNMYA